MSDSTNAQTEDVEPTVVENPAEKDGDNPTSVDESQTAEKSEDSNSKSSSPNSEKSKQSKTNSALKVDILLKHAGDAPIMKRRKWTVDRSKKISWVAGFIKKYIKSDPSETLFLYVNQSFAPAPDTDLGSIFDCFGSDGKLVLHYCKTQAWG